MSWSACSRARELTSAAKAIERASKGQLARILARGDLQGRLGTTLLLHDLAGIAAERVLLVGLGKAGDFGPKEYRESVRSAVRALAESGTAEAALFLAEVKVKGHDREWALLHAAAVAADVTYRFDQLKSKKNDSRPLARLTLGLTGKSTACRGGSGGARCGARSGAGPRQGSGQPAEQHLHAELPRRQAQALARSHKLRCEVLEEKDMQKLGMGSLLSVDARQRTSRPS